MTTNKTAISLFAGAGGDSYGMKLSGLDVISYVEKDKYAIETHKTMFPDCELWGDGDITKLSDEKLIEYRNKLPSNKQPSLVVAGFPCQGFSNAGKKNKDDERNNLFNDFVRVVKIFKPKWIIGENVQHILKMKTSSGDSVPDIITKAFVDIGYNMLKPKIYSAKNYDVPQDRKRCLFIGCLDKTSLDKFHKDITDYESNRSLSGSVRGLRQSVKFEKTLFGSICVGSKKEYHEFMKSMDKKYADGMDKKLVQFNITQQEEEKLISTFDPSSKVQTNLRKCYDNKQLSFGKRNGATWSEIVDIDKPSKTIICTYGRMPRLFIPIYVKSIDKVYIRQFTSIELQQIQGFPAEFKFSGDYYKRVTQIGNAIPPPLCKNVVDKMDI